MEITMDTGQLLTVLLRGHDDQEVRVRVDRAGSGDWQLKVTTYGLDQREPQNRVVGVRLANSAHIYKYLSDVPTEVGAWVRVTLPSGVPFYGRVMSLGRHGWSGDLSPAKVIEQPE